MTKTIHLTATLETVENLMLAMNTAGMFEALVPLTKKTPRPEIGSCVSVRAVGSPLILFAWVRTVQIAPVVDMNGSPRVQITAGKKLNNAAA